MHGIGDGARERATQRCHTTHNHVWWVGASRGCPFSGLRGAGGAKLRQAVVGGRVYGGALERGALLQQSARKVLVNTPSSSHTNFAYISLCLCVCVLAGAHSTHRHQAAHRHHNGTASRPSAPTRGADTDQGAGRDGGAPHPHHADAVDSSLPLAPERARAPRSADPSPFR